MRNPEKIMIAIMLLQVIIAIIAVFVSANPDTIKIL
jgi:hypothetical protein